MKMYSTKLLTLVKQKEHYPFTWVPFYTKSGLDPSIYGYFTGCDRRINGIIDVDSKHP